MNPLKQSSIEFEETRKKMLEALVKKRYEKEDVTESFIQQEVDYYIGRLQTGEPALTLRPQLELTDATSLNEEMREMEVDLHTVFNQLDLVSQKLSQHQQLNESIINDVRVRINKTNEKIEELGYQVRTQSSQSVFYETFLDYQNKEQDMRFYTERDGEEVAPAYQLTIDPHQKSLKLPLINQENQLVNFAGVKMASAKITKQLGSGFIRSKNPEHSIDKAIDTSYESYWNESILVDEPLRVDLGLEYYGLDFGATCEVEITFDYLSKINEITLTPFTEYPLDVVSILVYDNDVNHEPFELMSPTAVRKNTVSSGIVSYQFQEVLAKRVTILLNQRHYVKKDIIVNVDDKTMIDAWLENHGHVSIDENRLFLPVEQDQLEQYPFWMYLKEYMKDRTIDSELKRYEDVDFANRIHLSKYEYQYGMNNIAMNMNEYFYEGVHVTEALANTSVHLVELETKEEHPILEKLLMPVTNIEYYLTDVENPSASDWFPILPKNTEEIISERLYPVFDGGQYIASSRFDIDRIMNVRGNGEKMLFNIHYTLLGSKIVINQFDPSRIYTLDYIPEPTAYTVDFMEQYTTRFFDTDKGETIERIEAKKANEEFVQQGYKNEIKLSYFPFIDKNELNRIEDRDEDWHASYLSNAYVPFKLRLLLPSGEYIDQRADQWDASPVYIENMTDYYDANRSLLEPFTGLNYQYRIEKNVLKFNTALPEGTKIIAEYPYLTGPIRMKIIMRRNLHETEGLTPFLHEYKLAFQTLI